MELKQITNIHFSEGRHTYTKYDADFNETQLQGITGMIHKCVCPDLYPDVDEEVLAKAAAHGTRCHKLCEAFDEAHLEPTDDDKYTAKCDITHEQRDATITTLVAAGEYIEDPELYKYIELMAANDLLVEASEYLVTDDHAFASCIDKVVRESATEVSLIDLKFTYKYMEEPVRWQLSFYADMFEQCNPDMKVKDIYCIHIHAYKDGKITADLHKLTKKRIPTDILEECKVCYLTDRPFDNPLAKKERELPQELAVKAERIAQIFEAEKKAAADKKMVMEDIKQLFEQNPDVSKFKHPLFTVSKSVSSTSISFDMERFQQDHPDLYKEYFTAVKTTPSRVTVKLNK